MRPVLTLRGRLAPAERPVPAVAVVPRAAVAAVARAAERSVAVAAGVERSDLRAGRSADAADQSGRTGH